MGEKLIKSRENEINEKFLYLLMAVLLPQSCSPPPKKLIGHYGPSYVMADYYIANLAYPRDGEQFCYNFFRQDSLNGFSFIRSRLEPRDEFTENIQFPADYHQYKDYVGSIVIEKQEAYLHKNKACEIFGVYVE